MIPGSPHDTIWAFAFAILDIIGHAIGCGSSCLKQRITAIIETSRTDLGTNDELTFGQVAALVKALVSTWLGGSGFGILSDFAKACSFMSKLAGGAFAIP